MKYKPWHRKYPDYDARVDKLLIDSSWEELTKEKLFKSTLKNVNEYISEELKEKQGKINFFPYPSLVFNAFNLTPLNNVNVVILGQDPYPKMEKKTPQAMGLSFSVQNGITIPSSLRNIYKNLLKNGHIKKYPEHGDLTSWAKQGCLMINTALTVKEGVPNSHEYLWKGLSNITIQHISENTENTAFILWGKNSLSKLPLINQKKHKVFISSHPSGLSCAKKLQTYESFNDSDNFGKVNEYLKIYKKNPIDWNIV